MPLPVEPLLPDTPEAFRRGVEGLAAAVVRSDVVVRPTAAPVRIAPYAHALLLDVGEATTGRVVYLHDPDGQPAWEGTDRLVLFARAPVEAELAADPLLAGVVWSWLTDSLHGRGALASALGGTVTVTSNARFGALASLAPTHDVELRCSWSPAALPPAGLGPHLVAVGDLLAALAGLPPEVPGVVPLTRRKNP
ncbi:MAG: DUF3000 family protein [Mycobacteriales bacterium]